MNEIAHTVLDIVEYIRSGTTAFWYFIKDKILRQRLDITRVLKSTWGWQRWCFSTIDYFELLVNECVEMHYVFDVFIAPTLPSMSGIP